MMRYQFFSCVDIIYRIQIRYRYVAPATLTRIVNVSEHKHFPFQAK